MANDCFHIPGSKTYELLPDVDMYASQHPKEEEEQEQRSNKKKVQLCFIALVDIEGVIESLTLLFVNLFSSSLLVFAMKCLFIMLPY